MGVKKLPDILSTNIVARSHLFVVESMQLRFSNGEQRQYERMKAKGQGAVMIIPVNANSEWLLINEYCAGTHQYELSFPKGVIDAGETPEEAAQRELKEEVGHGAKHLVALKILSLAPGYFNAQMHIFLAFDLYPEQLVGDEPEALEVVKWPLNQQQQLLEEPKFNESRSVAGLFLARQWIDTHPEVI